MDSITLTFPKPLNVSVQIGDTAYYTNDTNGETIIQIGEVTSVSTYSIACDIPASTPRPNNNSFILFSKTNAANISGLTGYFAEAVFKNNSTEKIELFSIGSEIFESSK